MTDISWVGPVATQMAFGLLRTVELAALAIILSSLVGLILGLIATLPFVLSRILVRAYIELWRGLPVLVSLFLIFFALPVVGLTLSTLLSAAIGLTLWGSANIAEIVRGGIKTIPTGQHLASTALGMSWLTRMRYVILPQAWRRLLPPTIGIWSILVQGTSAAALIGYHDILFVSRSNVERL